MKKLKEEIDAVIQFYHGRNKWAFNKIQEILDKKEKGDLSIDLDIKMKIFTQVHNDSVKSMQLVENIKSTLLTGSVEK